MSDNVKESAFEHEISSFNVYMYGNLVKLWIQNYCLTKSLLLTLGRIKKLFSIRHFKIFRGGRAFVFVLFYSVLESFVMIRFWHKLTLNGLIKSYILGYSRDEIIGAILMDFLQIKNKLKQSNAGGDDN